MLPTNTEIYCIGKRKKKPKADKVKVVKTKTASGDVTHINIIPGETWIKPGASITFKAQGFTEDGSFAKNLPDLTWAVSGLKGELNGTVFTAAKDAVMQAGVITVKAGDVTASARLRIVPELPLTFDFENNKPGLPPPGWISSKLKSQVIEQDGKKVLKKLADRPAPPFARLRCYMTPPIDAGYTIQADMLGESKKKRFIPDMGLINSRYNLILLGTSEMTRKLRLVTWDPMPRLQKDIEFDWKPDAWYSVKMSVDIKDGKGLVKGKVWPRGDKEPAEWTIEAEDPYPNAAGSPGLYAYSVNITSKSPGTPVYFDNVSITRN